MKFAKFTSIIMRGRQTIGLTGVKTPIIDYYKTEDKGPVLVRIETVNCVLLQWIDAGGNPAMRHEGGAPSNNLIKDAPHRATVFVGPTLKSLLKRMRVKLEGIMD